MVRRVPADFGRGSLQLAPEALEARRLLAIAINEFGGSTLVTSPSGIASGPDGNLWFTESNPSAGAIGRVTPSGAIQVYSAGLTAGATPTGIVAGPDDALWFTDLANDKIGRIDTSGTLVEYPVKTPKAGPDQITLGTDGALWFTESLAGKIGRIDTSGKVTEYAIPLTNSDPLGITSGPDGALWFTESATDKIGRVTTAGQFTEFAAGGTTNAAPTGITTGPDGNLWYTDHGSGAIGRITPGGVVTQFSTTVVGPEQIATGSDGQFWFTADSGVIDSIDTSGIISASYDVGGPPLGITSGSDGNLWFTAPAGEHVGRLTTAGAIATFPSANALTPAAVPLNIATGPDGALWFTESSANQIGRIDTSGAISQYSTGISPSAGLDGIAVGPAVIPGGNPPAGGPEGLWFTESAIDKIGEISTDGLVTEFGGLGEGNEPGAITLGPGDNLWFTQSSFNGGNSAIGEITPSGSVTEFPLGLGNGYNPQGIAEGPDGALWFTMTTPTGGDIGRLTITGPNSYFYNFYTIPNRSITTSNPVGIVEGANDDLWFADSGNHAIGEVTTAGLITEYTQGLTSTDVPTGITAGPGGNYWFTDTSDDDPIGSITPKGVITLYQTPSNPSGPMGIATGPDNNLWFTESSANQIGQVVVPPSILVATGSSPAVVAGESTSFQVATFSDSAATNAANFSATIDYDDGTTGPGVVLPQGSTPGAFQVIGTHAFGTVGDFVLQITISTGTGSHSSIVALGTAVSPYTPMGGSVDGVAGRRTNTQVASFQDSDPVDTPADFTATVHWNDGTETAGLVQYALNPTNGERFAIYAGHAYGNPGFDTGIVTFTNKLNGLVTTVLFEAGIVAAPTFSPINEVAPASLTPGAGATGITLGPDGALWFTETAAGRIGRVDPDGIVTEFPLPDPQSQPTGITLGPDGALWFTESAIDAIGRITTQGVVSDYIDNIPAGAQPSAIVLGSDGNLWFTESGPESDVPVAIGRITPAGVVTQFDQGIPAGFAPDSITSGPDGALWFVGGGNSIGRITTQGVASIIPASTATGIGSITSAADDLWFTAQGTNQIGKLDPTTGLITLYGDPSIFLPNAITPGPDGALYFTSTQDLGPGLVPNYIEKITDQGVVTSFAGGIAYNSQLGEIAAGPDHNLYFVEAAGDRIGQVVLPQTSLTSLTGQPFQPVQGRVFHGTVATFADASTIPSPTNFEAVIDWGDGTSPDVDATTESGGTFAVPGSHTYANTGAYTVTIAIFNTAGDSVTSFGIDVEPTLTLGGLDLGIPADRTVTTAVALLQGADATGNANTYRLTINWGDGTSSPGSIQNADIGYNIFGTHLYDVPGSYQVTTTVQVIADPSEVLTTRSTATVTTPILSATPVVIRSTVGTLVQGVVAGVSDTSQYDLQAFNYLAAINWGDGTPPTPGSIVVDGSFHFEVMGSHVYATAGTFPVAVLIDKPTTQDFTATLSTAEVAASTPPLSFVVTNPNDSGAGSLRQAIFDADLVGGHAITFAIPGAGVATIAVASPLPAIIGPTIIDGGSQATFEGVVTAAPLVEIDGRGAGNFAGLTLGPIAVGSLVQDVSIFGFAGAQVEIEAADVTLYGNEIGLRADGTIPAGLATPSLANRGVEVFATGAVIGGVGLGEGNVLSGNDGWGILINGAAAMEASIVGNRIGLDPTGTIARPNLLDGVAVINGATHEFIGPGNTISGNSANGVDLLGSSADLVAGNDIGTDAGADRAIANGDDGVSVGLGSTAILIGGTGPFSTNILSGNASVGVGVAGGSTGITIEANRIGTDGSGERAIPNGIAGVLISDSKSNVVGPGNLISANGTSSPGAGIWIDGPGSTSNQVIGNDVGTDLAGQLALGNAEIGVLINQASGNTIGGDAEGASNLISGNTSVGLMIAGPGASGNLVAANRIGTNSEGTKAVGNGSSTQGAGVYIDNASSNVIGLVGLGNLISGNNYDGVQVFGPASSGNRFEGNAVGTDLAGTARLGNRQDGLLINGAPGTQVLDNILDANGLDGITVSGPGSTATLIQGNNIGRGIGGQPLGNTNFGILVINAAPSPTQANNINVNNTLGLIRDTSLAASTPVPTLKSNEKDQKVAVIHGKSKPSSPPKHHPKAKTAPSKKK